MSFEKFCPKCGKTTDAIIGGMCADCFLKRNDLFTVKEINIERCVKCGKIHFKGKWQGLNNEAIAEQVTSKVKVNTDIGQPKVFVELEPLTNIDFSVRITVTGFLEGTLVEQIKTTEFSLQKVSCDSCMKLVSNYREAIIQLRSSDSSEADAMLEVTKQLIAGEKEKDSLSAAIKILKGKNGYDLWIGSNKGAGKVARKLSKLYKTKIIASKKLIGENEDGKQRFRFTYCIKK